MDAATGLLDQERPVGQPITLPSRTWNTPSRSSTELLMRVTVVWSTPITW